MAILLRLVIILSCVAPVLCMAGNGESRTFWAEPRALYSPQVIRENALPATADDSLPKVMAWVPDTANRYYLQEMAGGTPGMISCGDLYHDNGKLYRRAACVNDVLHGKTICWDEHGTKISEETYHQGHRIKSKEYHQDGYTNTFHYDMEGNYHGLHIYTDHESGVRMETMYEHGLKQGSDKYYVGDWLNSFDTYENDELRESKSFYENGQLADWARYSGDYFRLETKQFLENGQVIFHSWLSENGDTAFYKEWSADGKLVADVYISNGFKINMWMTRGLGGENIKVFVYTDDETQTVRRIEMMDTIVIHESFTEKGVDKYRINWHPDGDTAMATRYTAHPHDWDQKRWNKDGELTHNYSAFWSAVAEDYLFRGDGFYTAADTTYHFKNAAEAGMPVVCWVIYHGDTIRLDYIRNSARSVDYPPKIISSNFYAWSESANQWVKNGVWKDYKGNYLLEVRHYEMGVRKGWEERYSPPGEPYSKMEGYYEMGEQGEWISYTTNGKWVYTYTNSVLNGEQRYYNNAGILIHSIVYADGKMSGDHRRFYEDGTLKTEGPYANDQPNGWWKYYNEKGQLILEGEYVNGERVKNWFEYVPSGNGESKRSKLKYT